ncbi:hypothetical protein GCM10022393_27310 [Aquimarina addita]|uniref:Major facilitator superfamily (MFS) profile domain-containing protein n=1 Tax=Aquimarina addita TaxID=870485 RepID=A0ABP6UPM0_9FLAO
MKKIKGLRWYIIVLIFLATVINYIDRTAFALLWPEMGKDLGMKNSDYATMFNWFLGAYAVGKFASGKLYDKIGTRLGFTVSIIVWSVASVFHAFARGIISLSIFRVMLGLGEAGNWPGAVKSNAEWFPVKQRAIAQGIFNAGASIGNVIAPFIIVFLYALFGWKTTYIILGGIGLIWVIPWLFINKAIPEKHPWITQEEKELILSSRIEDDKNEDDTKKEKSLSIGTILGHKESWGVLLCRFFIEPVWWFFAAWMPIYLNSQFGLSISEIAGTMWISYLFAAAGSIVGGWFSGLLMKSRTVDFARKTTITLGGILIFLGFLSIIQFVGNSSANIKVSEINGIAATVEKKIIVAKDTIILNENGALKFKPDSLFSGKKIIPITISNQELGTKTTSSIEILVTPVVDKDAKMTDIKLMSINLDPLKNSTDNLQITGLKGKQLPGNDIKLKNGTAKLTNGIIQYTPKASFKGQETITYTTKNASGSITENSLDVYVTPQNDSLTINPTGESNFMLFIYLAGLILFGFQFAIGNIQTISSDLFRGPSVGTLAGLAGTVAAVSPMIMNWFVGQITTSSYTPAFIAINVAVVLGVLVVFIFIRKIGPVRTK